jgi:hypothetical protein
VLAVRRRYRFSWIKKKRLKAFFGKMANKVVAHASAACSIVSHLSCSLADKDKQALKEKGKTNYDNKRCRKIKRSLMGVGAVLFYIGIV